jgi:hypothetical protein
MIEQPDPYQVLEVPYSASEAEIQSAFHAKMKLAHDPQSIIMAYGMIRDQKGRDAFRWDDLRFCFYAAETKRERPIVDIQTLIKELAFLSPWEIGEGDE